MEHLWAQKKLVIFSMASWPAKWTPISRWDINQQKDWIEPSRTALLICILCSSFQILADQSCPILIWSWEWEAKEETHYLCITSWKLDGTLASWVFQEGSVDRSRETVTKRKSHADLWTRGPWFCWTASESMLMRTWFLESNAGTPCVNAASQRGF